MSRVGWIVCACALSACAQIGSVEPNPAQSGAEVRIDGVGFGEQAGSVEVLLGATPLAVAAWSAGTIVATVPADAPAGTASLTLRYPSGTTSNAVALDVLRTDADGDGIPDAAEAGPGTDPSKPDTDGDGLWDGDELAMFGTNPLKPDTDGDSMTDRADPDPRTAGPVPHPLYAVFSHDLATGERTALTETRYMENHLLMAPPVVPGGPYILYQTYLADVTGDGLYTEADLAASAIGIMRADGTRPRLLSDLDASGRVANDGHIDVLPQASPDGRHILFASDRAGPPEAIRLWVMNFDGTDPRPLAFEAGRAPADDEMDVDPFWSEVGKVSFKRQKIHGATFSQVHVADLDTQTWTLRHVAVRTDGPAESLGSLPPGDFDPKISPDGRFVASYRKIDDSLAIPEHNGLSLVVGRFDLWVGLTESPDQPGPNSIAYVTPNPVVNDLMPRWSRDGRRLAFWSEDFSGTVGADTTDIVLVDLDLVTSPAFAPRALRRTNLTHGRAEQGRLWIEGMPSWHRGAGAEGVLLYSATGFGG